MLFRSSVALVIRTVPENGPFCGSVMHGRTENWVARIWSLSELGARSHSMSTNLEAMVMPRVMVGDLRPKTLRQA